MERVGRKATGMMSGLKREEAIEMDTMEDLGMVQVKKILKGGGGRVNNKTWFKLYSQLSCQEFARRLNRPWPIGGRIYDCLYKSYPSANQSVSSKIRQRTDRPD